MTTAQVTMMEKALERAQAQGVHIVGRGKVKATGRAFFAVSSATDSQRTYMVTLVDDRHLTCDCAAGKDGQYCKHRACVSARLREEARNKPISMWR